jgi:hypothetical protein
MGKGDSKMAARGKKQKACLLKWNLGETMETHLAGKATEKRQNFNLSTSPACSEHLHFPLNGETRRAPGPPPDTRARQLGKTQTREENRTTPACWKTYWNCIAFELGTLCWVFCLSFSFFLFALCSFVLFYFSPLMRQLQNNNWGIISRIGGWGTNTKKLLRLKLYCIWTWKFFNFFLFFILFYFLYIFFSHLLTFYFYSYFYSFFFIKID